MNDPEERLWSGEIEAAGIRGVKKPNLLRCIDWKRSGIFWRGTLSDYVETPVVSVTPALANPITLPTSWLQSLRSSLGALAAHPTKRINTRQDLIDRRIQERFGSGMNTGIERWITGHGDLHFANLTLEGPFLLDWEAWGIGPLGLDPAFLAAFAAGQPKVVEKIEGVFADWLSVRDGLICQLFACAELLRMIEVHGDHPELAKPLTVRAQAILGRLP
jgi:hypothetical protein